MKKTFILNTLFLFVFSNSYGQMNETNWWFFGSNGGLEFTTGVPVPAPGGMVITNEGSSAVSDPITGNLLFYSDGSIVYDRTHTAMPNGMGLMGNGSSTQSCLIVPKPGSTTLFYIFTTDCVENSGANGARYTVVDMTLNGGLGDVVTTEKNILLFAPCSEQLAATKHANCEDWWIMSKGYNNNIHHAYLLTPTGVSAPVSTTIGLGSGTLSYGQGKFSPDGTKYAMSAGAVANSQVFDFDNTTGIISNAITLLNTTAEDVYGLSFSGDNSKLYVFRGSGATDLWQYDVSSGVAATVLASGTLVGTTSFYPQMQLAKDYKIYVSNTTFSGSTISVINSPNVSGVACGLSIGTIAISGTPTLGMCNFPDSYFNEVNPCHGELAAFVNGENVTCNGLNNGSAWVSVTGNEGPYTLSWTPGGSTNDTITNLTPGLYTVIVTDSVGNADTSEITITQPLPLILDVAESVDSICLGSNVTLTSAINGGTTPYHYQWSTASGDTLSSLTASPISSGYITLDVVDDNGCTISDSVFITVLSIPNIVASPDTCICPGESVTLTASGTPGYVWNTGQTTASITVSPTSDSMFVVSYFNGICGDSDSTFVCVHPAAVVVASNDTSIQYNIEGNQVELLAVGDGPFNWTPSTGLSCNPCPNPTASLSATTTYTVSVTNANGCTASDDVTVTVFYIIVIPNVITPNGDGVNDKFKILGLPPSSSVSIFDRWGLLLHQSDAYTNDWTNSTDGVYYYILHTPDGKDFSGFFHIAGN